MEGFIHDLRFGARALRKNLGFTLIAVVTLALGIGANAAMLSVSSALLLRSLPFDAPDRVMVLWRSTPDQKRSPFSAPTFRDLYQRHRVFEALAMFRETSQNILGGDGRPERVRGLLVSAQFLPALGVQMHRGRGFEVQDDEPGAGRTIILGHGLWMRSFGGDDAVLGEAILLDNQPYTVVGILPAGLRQERLCGMPVGEFLLPIGIFADRLPMEERAGREFWGVGRLAADVDEAEARQDLARITRELEAEYADTYTGATLTGDSLRADAIHNLRGTLLLLMAAVGFVLLITCANLVNLFLTRAATRERELATRTALGARPTHLIRQQLAESLLVSLLGGLAGLAAGGFYLRTLSYVTDDLDLFQNARVDLAAGLATFGLALLVGLLVGWVPALKTIRGRSQIEIGARHGLLTRRSATSHRSQRWLVVAEVGLTFVLLVGTGLMLDTLARLSRQDPGFEPDRLLTLKVVLPQEKHDQREEWTGFFDQALERLQNLPGVEAAALTSLLPMGNLDRSIIAAGDRQLPKTPEMDGAFFQLVSPGFFRTMGIPLIEGRDFDRSDLGRDGSEPTVIISKSIADQYWPEKSAVGEIFAFEFLGTSENLIPQWRRIVGVVDDVRLEGLRVPPRHVAYAPYLQRSPYFDAQSPEITLMVRGRGEPLTLASSVLAELRDLDANQPVFAVRPMRSVLERTLRQTRLGTWMMSSFATLALILAIVGIYGVISQLVSSGTREIGTRVALGAAPARILELVFKRSLGIVCGGILIGVVAAAFLTRLMTAYLFGVQPLDAGIYAGMALVLVAVGGLATLVPAWRALKIQPTEALSYE